MGADLVSGADFPTFTKNQSADEKIDVLTNYLFSLLEQLRYTLMNLGVENINQTELGNITEIVNKPVNEDIKKLVESLAKDTESLTVNGANIRTGKITDIALQGSLQEENGVGGLEFTYDTVEGLTWKKRDAGFLKMDAGGSGDEKYSLLLSAFNPLPNIIMNLKLLSQNGITVESQSGIVYIKTAGVTWAFKPDGIYCGDNKVVSA